jgi:hypothetical protein
MAAYDLITLSYCKQNIPAITDTSQDSLLAGLITACSVAIEKYCRRDFYVRAYDELYSGDGDRRLLLRQYPLQSVQSVRYRPTTVLKVTNTNVNNVQARVSITSTGLTLFTMNAGIGTTSTSVTFASYATLTAVANAIVALGNGWSAQVTGDSVNYGSWPSADLYWPTSFGQGLSSQGALQCVAGSFAELKMHTYELAGFQWDARGWLLRAIPYTDPELVHPEDLIFPVGINNFRVQYTAGYNPIPEALQQACAQWVSMTWYATQRDPALREQRTAGTTQDWEAAAGPDVSLPPAQILPLLLPFRRHTVATNQG